MAYFRLTPAEYRTIAHIAQRHDFVSRHLPAFRRVLLRGLGEVSPELGAKLAAVGWTEVELLYEHFRPTPPRHPRTT
jgi:hypothetical protein